MLIHRGALRALWTDAGDPIAAPLVASASDRRFWDRVDAGIRARVLAESDRLKATAWPQPLLSQWSDYARAGDRTVYETAVFARNRRIRLAVVAAALDPSPERVHEAADGLWLKCEQATWCWPAHDDAFSRGRMTPDRERPFVDLGAGEDAALAAWSVLVLGDLMDEHLPGLPDRLGAETAERVLEPFVARRDWHWEGAEGHVHNWAPWIHGNLVPAAVAFAGPDLRDRVLELCVDGLDRYLAQLPADGAIDEGYGYWWQGAARAFDALDLLDGLCSGAVSDAVRGGALTGLAELVRFPQRMQFGADWFASFADASARCEPDTPWHSLYRAARLCGASDAAEFAMAGRGGPAGFDHGVAGGLGRMLAEIADAGWHAHSPGAQRAHSPGAPRAQRDETQRPPQELLPLPRHVWLPSIGVGLRRPAAGTDRGPAVLAKGGTNGENHNHNDLGSVAVAVDGVPLLIDLGRATYTADTFSPRRYELWNMRSDWHSTPLPRGIRQSEGAAWRAPTTEIADGWRIDLSGAYPGLEEPWWRTVRLDGDVVVIGDESPAIGHPDTRVIVVCAGVPEHRDGGVLVPGREGSRGLLLLHDDAEVDIETVAVDDPYLRESWGGAVSRMLFAPASAGHWEMRGSVR